MSIGGQDYLRDPTVDAALEVLRRPRAQTPLPPMSMGAATPDPYGQYAMTPDGQTVDPYGQYVMLPDGQTVDPAMFLAPSAPRQYQSLTPEMYNNFYANRLADSTTDYSGLDVPNYNDPNSKYLPPPPPPTVMAGVASSVFPEGGGDSNAGGVAAASGADIGAAPGDGISMGVDANAGGPGGGSGGDGGCVIATYAVANGNFTKREKQKAVVWCVKTLHSRWWGESIRRGYRFYGNRAISAGKAHEYYDEFRDFIRFATGTKRNTKTAKIFIWRSAQFFVTGLFVKGN
ncbi:hypothetical protein K0U83_26120 [bacterium]|nr:hypothetical protein [bacterium]